MLFENLKWDETVDHVTVPGSMFHSSVDSSFNWLDEGKRQKPLGEHHPVH